MKSILYCPARYYVEVHLQFETIASIELRACNLMHAQLRALLPTISRCPQLVRLDVSHNRLDDSAADWERVFASVFQVHGVCECFAS